MKLQSGYATLDVKQGRKKLARHINKGGCVEVVIHGFIDCPFGNDDGVSQAFNVDVTGVHVTEIGPREDSK